MFKRKSAFVAILLVLVLILGSLTGCGAKQTSNDNKQPAAQDKPYYDGKTITLIVPNSPGKGMDTYARMIVPYIQKYSGAKDIVVKNLTGAGGLVGTNTLWSSKPDGLTIAFTSIPSLMLAQMSGSDGVTFDATKFTYIGRASTEPRILTVGGKSSINSAEDLTKLGRNFKFPTQGTDEDFFTMATLAKSLGFKLKAITGYEGNADTAMAVVKGEGDGHITAIMDAKTMIKEGDKKAILVVGMERSKEYPDVPNALEVIKDENGKQMMQGIVNMLEMHRSFFGPANMDENATKALREAVWKALNDPELIQKAEKAGTPITPMKGEEVQQKVAKVVEASQHLRPVLKEAVQSTK
ncbi:MAG: tripartite tricarboxylate transporter substrate-binding protein [Desulfitobacterium hafniense]|nr:tripartite tricarboxylate transporter substrate-binding protein [Desulfitobacterium hafniense]